MWIITSVNSNYSFHIFIKDTKKLSLEINIVFRTHWVLHTLRVRPPRLWRGHPGNDPLSCRQQMQDLLHWQHSMIWGSEEKMCIKIYMLYNSLSEDISMVKVFAADGQTDRQIGTGRGIKFNFLHFFKCFKFFKRRNKESIVSIYSCVRISKTTVH